MINILFTFFLIAGIYRYRDGCKRLKRAPEAERDERWKQIPDADVVEWWHRLTRLDREFGVFFKRYGMFLIAVSVFNLLLNLKTEAEIPLNGFTIIYWFPAVVAMVIGYCIMGDNDSRLKPTGHWPLEFHLQKEAVIIMYDCQAFLPYADWTNKPFHDFREKRFYYDVDSTRTGLQWLLVGSTRVKWGAVICYGNYIILILIVTFYQIFNA